MWYEIINLCLDEEEGIFGSTTWAPYKSSRRFIGRNVKYNHSKVQIIDRLCSWTSTFYCVSAFYFRSGSWARVTYVDVLIFTFTCTWRHFRALQQPADSVCNVYSCKYKQQLTPALGDENWPWPLQAVRGSAGEGVWKCPPRENTC